MMLVGMLWMSACTDALTEDPTDTTQDNTGGDNGTDDTPDISNEAITSGELNLPAQPLNYANAALPAYYQNQMANEADNTPAGNEITDWGATLGRVLFYDKGLSANNTTSCASCHGQTNGFSDPRALSLGFEGGETGRNSMGLSNARYYENGHFFWDERAATLEEQVLMPIQDQVEMGLTLTELVERVSAEDHYQYLFNETFGSPEVNSDRIARALAQFVRSIVSFNSRFDEGLAATNDVEADFPNFTAAENQGKALFFGRAGCNRCHEGALFIADEPTNNGLDAVTTDPGVAEVTGNPADEGKFKVPSLRNIAETGPFMHDGRFATLARVVAHYNNGVQAHPNTDNRLLGGRGGGNVPRRLNLSAAEQAALVSFLETLSDDALAQDERFSDPFVQ